MLELELLESPLLTQVGVSFLAGLLTFFTPCVYPLVPVTVAMFGSQDPSNDCTKNKKFSNIKNSWLYALGIATTYTSLGILAAQGGLVFGSYVGSTWFLAVVSLILITMFFSVLGIFNLPFFHYLQNLGCKIRSTGSKGAFLSGLVSGLIAAPCVCPTLAAILMLSASHQSPTLGSMLLAFYAAGLSLPFVLLGSFSGLINKLPKCGAWLCWIKSLVAVGILLTLFYLFSGHLDWFTTKYLTFSDQLYNYLVLSIGFLIGVAGIILGSAKEKKWISFIGVLALSLFAYNIFIFVPTVSDNDRLKWKTSLETVINQTKDSVKDQNTKQLIVVQSAADWCFTCRELEEKTFSSYHVQSALASHSLVKVDFSETTTENEKFSKNYQVMGVPTILFLDKNGNEISGSRLTGFITAQQFVTHLKQLTEQ